MSVRNTANAAGFQSVENFVALCAIRGDAPEGVELEWLIGGGIGRCP